VKINKKYWLFIFFISLACSIWFLTIFWGDKADVDEKVHYRQINRFVKGDFEILSNLTTIPGYHIVIAFFVKIGHHHTLETARLISLLLSIITIWVFFMLSKKFQVRDPLIKTLQFVFLPISFFYFPLLYTDIFSLLLVLSAFYFSLKNRYKLSALFSLASILTRQTNIVWAVFIWLYTYLSTYGFSFSLKIFRDYLRQTIGYISLFIAFVIFTLINHGIAIGDRNNHITGFYLGNVYLFLATIGFLFLPVLITSLHKIDNNKLKNFFIFGIGPGALIASSFIFIMPKLSNNNIKLTFFMNIILQGAYHQYRWIYALAIFLGYLVIFTANIKKKDLLFFIFALLFLVPSFLVAQRYLIIPLIFLLLFRKETDKKTEYCLLFYFSLLSLFLTYIVFTTAINF